MWFATVSAERLAAALAAEEAASVEVVVVAVVVVVAAVVAVVVVGVGVASSSAAALAIVQMRIPEHQEQAILDLVWIPLRSGRAQDNALFWLCQSGLPQQPR